MRKVCVLSITFLSFILLALAPARAGDDHPNTDRPMIAVVGDSLADGMWNGMYRTVGKSKTYALFRGAKNATGFSNGTLIDMIDRAVAAGPPQALVMMVGANDRRTIFVEGKPSAAYQTPEWREIYAERIAAFMDHAGRLSVPLVWILLPVMRSEEATRDAQMVNAMVTEAAKSRPHVTLIDTFAMTVDEHGAYTAHFADLSGQRRLMRAGDGIHFEAPGYDLIASLVLKRLRELSPRFAQLSQ